jgi:hypothetical protein
MSVVNSGYSRNFVSWEFRRRALEIFSFCQWCQKALTFETSTLDHIRPLRSGGSELVLECLDNYALSCQECNSRRDQGGAPGSSWERPPFGPPFWSQWLRPIIQWQIPPHAICTIFVDGKPSTRDTYQRCQEELRRGASYYQGKMIEVVPTVLPSGTLLLRR